MSISPYVAGLLLVAVVAPVILCAIRTGGRQLRRFTGMPLMMAESVFIGAAVTVATVGIRWIWW
jgi:hypothetical protein